MCPATCCLGNKKEDALEGPRQPLGSPESESRPGRVECAIKSTCAPLWGRYRTGPGTHSGFLGDIRPGLPWDSLKARGCQEAPLGHVATTANTWVKRVLGDSFQGSIAAGEAEAWGISACPQPRAALGRAGRGEGPRQAVLVIEDDVWPPHETAGDAYGIQATIVIGVPS